VNSTSRHAENIAALVRDKGLCGEISGVGDDALVCIMTPRQHHERIAQLEAERDALREHLLRWATMQGGFYHEDRVRNHRPTADGLRTGYNPDCQECGWDWPCPSAVIEAQP
jgi:hypothetical protein